MSHPLRDSLELIRHVRPHAGQDALEGEIMQERASSLSHAEKQVIRTVAALDVAAPDHDVRLANARQAVWSYFVQRELCGFRRHSDVIADLGIPREVLNGLGAIVRR